jgi:hypothetical protein
VVYRFSPDRSRRSNSSSLTSGVTGSPGQFED